MTTMTRTRVLRLLLIAAMSAGSARLGLAQTQVGTVEGKIVDQQAAVLPGVTVTLAGPRGVQTTVTDGEGNFRFVGVTPGTEPYVLRAELTGFLPQEQRDVVVSMGKTVRAEVPAEAWGDD